jgi:Zn finger protein HypA/HybF involved in hydrogenase expression
MSIVREPVEIVCEECGYTLTGTLVTHAEVGSEEVVPPDCPHCKTTNSMIYDNEGDDLPWPFA